ncbi:MAG: DUF5688 family protein [Lachnospiraceae bacterium]|nr:DUF5688 family protein [Lachnospiraceae bacterium]
MERGKRQRITKPYLSLLILVPYNQGEQSKEYLAKMVDEVNATEVPQEDILSDKVYIYLRENKCITL